jgi:hypothetical protein
MSDNIYNDIIDKSEALFEKNLVYLSVGTLSISMIFIEKIVPINNAIYLWVLITSWTLLVLSLLLNLISHQISIYHARKSQFENEHLKLAYQTQMRNYIKRKCVMNTINYINIGLLILGISSIVLFSSININNRKSMCAKQTKPEEWINIQSGKTIEKKGAGPKMPDPDKSTDPKIPKASK